MSELQGQLEIGLHGEIGETTKPVEGYDAEGNLINPALEEGGTTSFVTADAVPPSP